MNETQTASERDERVDLLQHPGFLRLLAKARDEYDQGYGRRCKEAVNAAKQNGEDLYMAVEKVDFAVEQINALLSWPKERVQQLSQPEPKGRFPGLRRA